MAAPTAADDAAVVDAEDAPRVRQIIVEIARAWKATKHLIEASRGSFYEIVFPDIDGEPATTPPSIGRPSLIVLSHVVRRHAPYIRDCHIHWDATSGRITATVEVYRASATAMTYPPSGIGNWCTVDTMKYLDDQRFFDVRHQPPNWEQARPKIQAVSDAIYNLDEFPPAVHMRLTTHCQWQKYTVSYMHMARISYSDLERISELANIDAMTVRAWESRIDIRISTPPEIVPVAKRSVIVPPPALPVATIQKRTAIDDLLGHIGSKPRVSQ